MNLAIKCDTSSIAQGAGHHGNTYTFASRAKVMTVINTFLIVMALLSRNRPIATAAYAA